MPNVLMVTPYWPPVNKVGVWRVLRTARYLPERGWKPVISHFLRSAGLGHVQVKERQQPARP